MSFDDLLQSNERYRVAVHDPDVVGRAGRGLAVVTCIDSRIDPLAVLGLKVGDAKIIRNAGARVTDDVLRSLVLAVNLLDVDRVCVVPHSRCALGSSTEQEMRRRIESARGVDADGWDFLATTDQVSALRLDIARIRACPLLPAGLEVGGLLFDVDSGAVEPVDTP
ncbi:MAG: beta-class carbonic anhydrase [Acidimicrobiales bacterium]